MHPILRIIDALPMWQAAAVLVAAHLAMAAYWLYQPQPHAVRESVMKACFALFTTIALSGVIHAGAYPFAVLAAGVLATYFLAELYFIVWNVTMYPIPAAAALANLTLALTAGAFATYRWSGIALLLHTARAFVATEMLALAMLAGVVLVRMIRRERPESAHWKARADTSP